ncbi:hypothetical protein R3Q06_23125 [Rhodococcus erythropolis]|uniref:hypothetical protein n=1 Tax=Rhodococcus erythropolis TaxID=1833 RepID=UPI002949B5EF|nr:hypothetical protein [Rhodococcus erythropolis]MDV6276395.1 hypothetical protein [Rhodococcus erythropolis]
MSTLYGFCQPRHRAAGIIANLVAEAKANGHIGYSETFADRILDELDNKGYTIVKKAGQS